MAAYINSDFQLGVLGGGQLGKMLALAAGNWHLPITFLDKSSSFPAGPYSNHFAEGDFNNYEDVLKFGQDKDVLTIEIEHVNTAALHKLESAGKIVHPAPAKLDIIKDKGLQKQFYKEHQIPTAPFTLYDSKEAILQALQGGTLSYPFVQKSRTAGYDGRGVAVINSEAEREKLLSGPSLVEDRVDIKKEIAVIAARNPSGAIECFPPVEMSFHPEANLVEFLFCPAQIDPTIAEQALQLARTVIETFDLCGLLAVEMFLTQDNQIWVNEVAPRPHNSGHHTIDSCYTSQFEQHIRAILDLPLGSTKLKSPSVMVNLLGAPGYTGQAVYKGLEKCLAIEGVKVHLYGKTITKPHRKMGHATVLSDNLADAISKARKVQELLTIMA